MKVIHDDTQFKGLYIIFVNILCIESLLWRIDRIVWVDYIIYWYGFGYAPRQFVYYSNSQTFAG